MKIKTTFEDDAFQRLQSQLKNTLSPKQLRKQTYIVLSKTGAGHKTDVAKRVREMITAKSAEVKKSLMFQRPKQANNQVAKFTVKKTKPLPLGAFTSTQNKTGVSYKIDKTKGRKTAPGVFKIRRWNNDVFRRVPDKGKPYQLKRLYGVSPWGIYLEKIGVSWSKKKLNERMEKELARRIQFLLSKQK